MLVHRHIDGVFRSQWFCQTRRLSGFHLRIVKIERLHDVAREEKLDDP
ncbi:MAG: hypothetical protein HY268_26605, partial [Deltaproteobacteria bacterium]|nr:hypothetical protein [Deltaproteobacteria bacterium]